MELNKEIRLTNEPFDVSVLGRDHRVLYFAEEKKIIIKSAYNLAVLENMIKYGGKAIVLTASQCPRRYPQVFTDSSKKQFIGDKRTIMLRVPTDMYTFCCQQGNITEYLQSLIKKDMEKKK